jgi:hypothetical protein
VGADKTAAEAGRIDVLITRNIQDYKIGGDCCDESGYDSVT